MRSLLSILFLLALAAVGWWWFQQDAEGPATRWEAFTVQRGPQSDILREVGELAPRDPTLIQAPFAGEIKWIEQDGTWVEAGEKIVEFEEEELVKTVTDLRTAVVDKKQELRLKRLEAEQTRIAEQQRVELTRQDFELAQIRHRILTTSWQGGDRLLQLDREVRPLEETLERLQTEIEPLEDDFRAARDAYQTALQEWQAARGELLEVKMGSDLKKPSGGPAGGGRPGKPGKPSTPDQVPPPASEPVADPEAEVAAKKEVLNDAEAELARHAAPYETRLAEIDALEAEARELHILIEIEKRGLPAMRLEIDRAQSQLRLDESRRQVESGRRAFDAGAMSRVRYDQLVADATAKAGQLEILNHRLEIARRPAEEDEVAASEATLAAARRALENAEAVFQREMDILASDQSVIEAQLAQAIGRLDRNGKGFEAAIEGTIRMLEAERGLLDTTDPDALQRRAEIDRELDALDAELAEARAAPPNVVLAPSAGLLRLRENDDRLTDIGDRWDKGNTVAMLYPPGKMDVELGINEANFRRVQAGQTCRVTIPALNQTIDDARVALVSRIGKDRQTSESRWTATALSGITEFDLSIDLNREGHDFRQGMTVHIDILTDQREDALWLPAAAVHETTNGTFQVTLDRDGAIREIEGEHFADDVFLITGGLDEDDTVLRAYGGPPQ